MNINSASVIKAAIIGAVINSIIGLMTGATVFLNIAVVSGLVSLLACCGGLLIPVMTGALYGYFTPGRETLAEAATGGALAGLVAGLFYGVMRGLGSVVFGLIDRTSFDVIITNTGGTLLLACCGAVIFGSLLGGIGGAVWTAVQGDK